MLLDLLVDAFSALLCCRQLALHTLVLRHRPLGCIPLLPEVQHTLSRVLHVLVLLIVAALQCLHRVLTRLDLLQQRCRAVIRGRRFGVALRCRRLRRRLELPDLLAQLISFLLKPRRLRRLAGGDGRARQHVRLLLRLRFRRRLLCGVHYLLGGRLLAEAHRPASPIAGALASGACPQRRVRSPLDEQVTLPLRLWLRRHSASVVRG